MTTETITFPFGEHISTTCAKACEIAKKNQYAVQFNFNGISLTANPTTLPEKLIREFNDESERRHKEYVESPEYKAMMEEQKRKEEERKANVAAILVEAPANMTTSDVAAWEEAKAVNSTDPYSAAIISYSELWARLMEARIAKGEKLAECAEECSHLANEEGITGFMYGAAVATLSKHWIKGEALRLWHNLQFKNGAEANEEDGAVINPAVIIIAKKP